MKSVDLETGFTLIEVLVATVVLSLIIGPMTAAIILGFKTEGLAAQRLTTSQGRFLLNVYLPRDAMQATSAYGSPVSQSNAGSIPFGKTCAGESVAGQVPSTLDFTQANAAVPLVLTWTGEPTQTDSQGHVLLGFQSYEADYVLATEPGRPSGNPEINGQPQTTGDWLWRFVYTTGISYPSGPTGNATGCTLISGSRVLITRDVSPAAGATGSVTMNAAGQLQLVSLQYTDSSGNSYSVSGGARA